jgi:hypothetical protein
MNLHRSYHDATIHDLSFEVLFSLQFTLSDLRNIRSRKISKKGSEVGREMGGKKRSTAKEQRQISSVPMKKKHCCHLFDNTV